MAVHSPTLKSRAWQIPLHGSATNQRENRNSVSTVISFCSTLSLQSLEYPCAWRLRSRTWAPIESSLRVTTLWTVAPYPHSQWVLQLHLPLLRTLWSPCCSRSPAPPPAGSGSGVPSSRSLSQLPNPGLGLGVEDCPSQPSCLVSMGPLRQPHLWICAGTVVVASLQPQPHLAGRGVFK